MNSQEHDDTVPPYVAKEILEYVYTMMHAKDAASKVLRLHALTEYYLDRLLNLSLKQGEVVTSDDRFTYYHKIKIAHALGLLGTGLVGCLRKLAKLRNRCAHELVPQVTMEEAQEIGRLLGPRYELALQEHSGENKELSALGWALFEELSIKVGPLEAFLEELRISLRN